MKTILITLFILCIQSTLFGQNEIIVLKNDPIDMQTNNFFIRQVIDGRSNKENIGFVQKGAFNRKVNADLEEGVENSIFNYLKNSLKQDTTTIPIILRVVYLNISEHTGFATETGKAEIKIPF